MSEPTHAPIGDPARRGEDEVTGEFYPSSRDTEIERIADLLHDNGVACEMHGALRNYQNAHGVHAARLYDAGLRSQPASEPTTWAGEPTSAPSLDVERLMKAWLNAMTEGEHNERCLDQGAMDCPVAAEVREFTPKVAAEYQRLSQPADNEAAATP